MSVAVERVPHAAAELVPAMTEAEFQHLKAGIKEKGQLHPILLLDDLILDGRHRYRACVELGIEPMYEEYQGDDPVGEVFQSNLNRRNLTTGQRAAAALGLLDYEKERAKERQRDHGGTAPGKKTLAQNSAQVKDAQSALAKAGEKVGVSRTSVAEAQALLNKRPDLLEKVKKGEISLNAATEESTGRVARKPTNGGTKKKPVYTTETKRGRVVAEKARDRINSAVGSCRGTTRALNEISVENALLVATPDEVDGWHRELQSVVSQINKFRKNLKEVDQK